MCDYKSWLLIPLDDFSAWNAVDLSCIFTMKTEKKMVSVTDAHRMLGDQMERGEFFEVQRRVTVVLQCFVKHCY